MGRRQSDSGAGNLYVSDTQNNQVVMVPNENGTLNGTDMIVLSISGLGSPHGIAMDGNGNLYVTDVTKGTCWKCRQAAELRP